jgi:transcription elongation factor GreA
MATECPDGLESVILVCVEQEGEIVTNTTGTVWMTAAALTALEEELRGLEQNPQEADAARLIELRDLVRRAETSAKPDDGLVEPGMVVTIRFSSDGSTETFLLGARGLVQNDQNLELDVYSAESPLGAAITGRVVGDTVSYEAPNGQRIDVDIVSASPFA